jgi:Autographiviridae endonuclease VII
MSSKRKRWKRAANEAERLERRRASRRKWRQTHWQRILADQRRRRRTDPVYLEKERARRRKSGRKWLLETTYGITMGQYEDMLARQDGRCGICERRPKGSLCVDHCHATRQVRKLLCRNCNSMLGFACDDPDVLELAAVYLLSTVAPLPKFFASHEQKPGVTRCLAAGIRHKDSCHLRRHDAQGLDKRAVLKKRCEAIYGISLEDHDRMFAQQGGRCRICKRKSKLFIDHCHVSGRVRGLLCNNCNCLIGFSGDDPSRLMAGSSYLHRFGCKGRLFDWMDRRSGSRLRGRPPEQGVVQTHGARGHADRASRTA